MKNVSVFANSVDPDGMLRVDPDGVSWCAAFHLGLHCLQKYPFLVYKGLKITLMLLNFV